MKIIPQNQLFEPYLWHTFNMPPPVLSIWTSAQVQEAPFGKAGNGPRPWTPVSHMGDPDGILRLLPSERPTPGSYSHWRSERRIENIFLCVSLPPHQPTKPTRNPTTIEFFLRFLADANLFSISQKVQRTLKIRKQQLIFSGVRENHTDPHKLYSVVHVSEHTP